MVVESSYVLHHSTQGCKNVGNGGISGQCALMWQGAHKDTRVDMETACSGSRNLGYTPDSTLQWAYRNIASQPSEVNPLIRQHVALCFRWLEKSRQADNMSVIGLWLRIYHLCRFYFISTSAMPWFLASDKLLLGSWLRLGEDPAWFQFRVDLKMLFITHKALHDLHFWATLSGWLGRPSRTLSYPWVSLGGHWGKND